MFYGNLIEKHMLWIAVYVSIQIKKKTQSENSHKCSHTAEFQMMAYSDGTSGCRPNICTHDLSCSPQGQSVEKYSDIIVSACVCARVWTCSLVILQARIHTHTQSPEAKQNNGALEMKSLAGVSLHCVSLSLSLCLIQSEKQSHA